MAGQCEDRHSPAPAVQQESSSAQRRRARLPSFGIHAFGWHRVVTGNRFPVGFSQLPVLVSSLGGSSDVLGSASPQGAAG